MLIIYYFLHKSNLVSSLKKLFLFKRGIYLRTEHYDEMMVRFKEAILIDRLILNLNVAFIFSTKKGNFFKNNCSCKVIFFYLVIKNRFKFPCLFSEIGQF